MSSMFKLIYKLIEIKYDRKVQIYKQKTEKKNKQNTKEKVVFFLLK